MTSENSGPVAAPPSPSADSTDGSSVRSFEETAVRRIPVEIMTFSAVVAAGLLLIFDAWTAVFFFAGGLLSTLSFLWMKNTLAGILNRKKAEAIRSGLIFYALRFILILGVFLLIILVYPDKILAFAAGFSMVIPAFIIEAAKALALIKKWKA
jgi:hypothetical protein